MSQINILTKIAKEFKWEMSHRLTFHKGPCKNIHGHSYKLVIYLTGELDVNGLILDFYDIEIIVSPFIEKLDHAFLCSPDDKKTLEFLKEVNYKYFLSENFTTCEQMTHFFLKNLAPEFKKYSNIKKLGIRIYETSDAYAEIETEIN